MAIVVRRAADVRMYEADLSTYIVNNSNATAAQVIVSARGPAEPRRYSNVNDYLFDFGQPNAKTSFDHYAAIDYFKEGSDLWAVRALGAGYKYSAAIVKLTSTGQTAIAALTNGILDPTNPQWTDLVNAGETPLFLLYSKSGPGSYGNNISVSMESSNLPAPTSLSAESFNTGGNLAAATYEYVVSAISKTSETLASSPFSVIIAATEPTSRVVLKWNAVAGAVGYNVYRKVGTEYGLIAEIGAVAATHTDAGVFAPDTTKKPILSPANLPAPSKQFRLKVYDHTISATNPQEQFDCTLEDETDETGVQMEVVARLNPFSRYVSARSNIATLGTTPTLRTVATPVNLAGGNSGSAPTVADINRAWETFINKELYVVDVLLNAGKTAPAVQKNLVSLAERRADCVAFLDVPSTIFRFQEMLDFRNRTLNVNSSYASLFGPDLLETDPVNGKALFVPPSGAMAALYARSSRVGAPWFSMAGLNRGIINVLDVRNTFDDGQATALYQGQVNYMRKFIGRGIALWEQTTLYNKNSALQFLNVRMLCNILKRSMYDYLIYGLQEPNDDVLRKQIQYALETYLETVKNARGLSSYKVLINDANNPPALVNAGILAVTILIVPILAVREIQLSLVVGKEGLSVSERELAAISG